jgi:hypothetical protein
MNHFLKSLAAIGVCLVASAGCKSKLLSSRSAKANKRPATDVAESKAETAEEMSLGQASYEQFAANPTASPWGESPYHFGGAANTGGSSAFGGATTASSKRC